ncbi:TPA: hypothetical protein HA278_04220 [Candidatus Woesearchaeota archaeon]|nr:hypothetical protein [Candidatus Woesearchaeota archaeon]
MTELENEIYNRLRYKAPEVLDSFIGYVGSNKNGVITIDEKRFPIQGDFLVGQLRRNSREDDNIVIIYPDTNFTTFNLG